MKLHGLCCVYQPYSIWLILLNLSLWVKKHNFISAQWSFSSPKRSISYQTKGKIIFSLRVGISSNGRVHTGANVFKGVCYFLVYIFTDTSVLGANAQVAITTLNHFFMRYIYSIYEYCRIIGIIQKHSVCSKYCKYSILKVFCQSCVCSNRADEVCLISWSLIECAHIQILHLIEGWIV